MYTGYLSAIQKLSSP